MELNKEYWDKRYSEGNTGWDIGSVSTPLKEYIDQLKDKNTAILIPGGGSAYEANYLLEKGFQNITIIELSEEIVLKLKARFANTPQVTILLGDFFEHTGTYGLVLEQTFFCAFNPTLRQAYYKKMYDILSPKGKIAGVLFGVKLDKEPPPFGGTKEEYLGLMKNYFKPKTIELCYNSIPQRQGNELFIILERLV